MTTEERDKKFEENLNLVYFVINKMQAKMDRDDQIQIGSLGLLYAIEHFDPNRGNTFSTYATTIIRGFIQKEYCKEAEYAVNTCPMELPICDQDFKSRPNDKLTLEDLIYDPRDAYSDFINKDLLDYLFKQLTPFERKVMTLYYYENMGTERIARLMKKNVFFIKKIIHEALKKCRAATQTADPNFELLPENSTPCY